MNMDVDYFSNLLLMLSGLHQYLTKSDHGFHYLIPLHFDWMTLNGIYDLAVLLVAETQYQKPVWCSG